jgi:hypothetical protein
MDLSDPPSVSIRCRYREPCHPEPVHMPSGRDVLFRHPGYPDTQNILFSLSALDGPGDGGVHHDTARVACALLADARWDGFLSLTRDGPPAVAGPDDILTGSSYYFRLLDPDGNGKKKTAPPCPVPSSAVMFICNMTLIPRYR